jgi:hypothetical protein
MPITTILGLHTWIHNRIDLRIEQANSIQEEYFSSGLTPWRFRFLAESLLSNLWLDWNEFAKAVICISCRGSITRNGVAIPARVGVMNTTERITYEFSQYARGQIPKPALVHSSIVEPTWARPDKIVACLKGINMGNSMTLQAAFGAAGLPGPHRIQLVRNATAHKSRAMRVDAQSLRAFYSTPHFYEPIDIIWGVDPASGGVAIFDWLDDLKTISSLATE